jgi:tetratricopeptide (TPR) repeat protein
MMARRSMENGNITPHRKNGIRFHQLWAWLVCTILVALPGTDSFAQPIDPGKPAVFVQSELIRPDEKSDDAFVRGAASKYPSREAGSRALSAQGWAQLRAGKQDLAVENFYRAWLLHPKNYQVFWGSGAILAQRGKLVDAIDQLDTARELIDDPKETAVLLLDAAIINSTYAAGLPRDKQLERARYFVKANECFTESLENDPDHAASWRAWALSLYEQERYSEAAIKAERAQELNAERFPGDFLHDLKNKIAE